MDFVEIKHERNHDTPYTQKTDEHRKARITGTAQGTARRDPGGVKNLIDNGKIEEIDGNPDDFRICAKSVGNRISEQKEKDTDRHKTGNRHDNRIVGTFFGRADMLRVVVLKPPWNSMTNRVVT